MSASQLVEIAKKMLKYVSLWAFFVFLFAQNVMATTDPSSSGDESQTVAKAVERGSAGTDGGGGSDTALPDLFTGAFTYRIPINVPPGRNGIEPNLALTYRSGNGSSMFGMGWDLEIGSIERSTRNGINYSGDNFILRRAGSAVELIKYGTGNEYRAKIENEFLKIQKQSDGSSTYWIVTDKNGVRYFYGQVSATRQEFTTPIDYVALEQNRWIIDENIYVFKWCLDKVEDPHGNYMTFSYVKDSDQGQIYPDTISYTGNLTGSLLPTNQVKFYWETNPVAAEMYYSNFKIKTARRLRTIDIISNYNSVTPNRVRVYKATYTGDSFTLPQSLLAGFQEFGSDTQLSSDGAGEIVSGSFLPPVTFDYSPEMNAFKSKIKFFTENDNVATKFGGDFNGDGAVDMFQFKIISPGTVNVSLSNKSGVDPVNEWGNIDNAIYNGDYRATWYHILLSDFNSDGKFDYLFIGPGNKLSVSLSNGSRFEASQEWVSLGNGDYKRYTIADIKGTGKKSALFVDTDGTQKFVTYGETTECSGQVCTKIGNGDPLRYRYADFNGDGKTDVLFIDTNGELAVGLSNGANFNAAQSWQSLGNGQDPSRYLIGDFNGDGLTDILYVDPNREIWVALSTGKGFPAPVKWLGNGVDVPGDGVPANYRCFDLNGDGKTDLLFVTGIRSTFYVGLSTGSAFLTPSTWGQASPGFYFTPGHNQFFDINGDGKIDACIYSSYSPETEAQLSFDDKANLLTGISNGIGGYTKIEYGQFEDYFSHKSIGPIFVVKDIIVTKEGTGSVNGVTGGAGPASITNYSYANGFYNVGKKEFRGFNYARVTGPAGASGEQSITETWFHQGDATYALDENISTADLKNLANAEEGYMKGKPYRIRISDQNQVKLSETTIEYKANAVAPYFNPPYQSFTTTFDGGSSKQTTTVTVFDATFGNLLRKIESGDETDSRTIVINYNPNSEKWITGLPSSVSIYKGAFLNDSETSSNMIANKLKSTSYFYDGASDCNTASSNLPPEKGKVTSVVSWLKDGVSPETRMAYDSYGNLSCIRDPNSVVSTANPPPLSTIFSYDDTYTFPKTVTNPLGQQVTTEYYGVDGVSGNGLYGQIKSITYPKNPLDPTNPVESYEYDAFGRIKLETLSDGFQTSWSYNNIGIWGLQNIFSSNSAGLWTYSYIDGLGRIYKESKSGPDNKTVATTIIYDLRGAISHQSLPYFENLQPPVFTTFRYDSLGRVKQITNPDTSRTQSCYAGWQTVQIDENNHRKRETRDAFGRLVQVDEYEEEYQTCTVDVTATPYATTTYRYDILGHLTLVTDTRQNITSMVYDTLGRKTSMNDPDMGPWSYEYDKNGNLTLQTDARGWKTRFGYDVLGRLKTKDYAADGTFDVTYNYDEPTRTYSIGQLSSMSLLDGSISQTFDYDKAGRVVNDIKTVDGLSYSLRYGYDRGRLFSITYPDNEIVTYQYDTGGNLWTVDNYVTYYDYLPSGQPRYALFNNGVTTAYQYFPLNNRLAAITTKDKNLLTLFETSYNYDGKGNITTINDNRNLSHNYVSSSYTFPGPGEARPHTPLSKAAGPTYHYDANGNMDFNGQWTFDFENMPTTIDNVNFKYDGNGSRTKKSVAGVTKQINIDKLYECYLGNCRKYIFADDNRIAVNTYGVILFYHQDHLGSTNVVTDGPGNTVQEVISYYPFGETLDDTGLREIINVPYKFTGQELDSETGLYNYNARLYSPDFGRFISPDTIVSDPTNPQSLNRYSYVLNNPLNYTDPTGHEPGITLDQIWSPPVWTDPWADYNVPQTGLGGPPPISFSLGGSSSTASNNSFVNSIVNGFNADLSTAHYYFDSYLTKDNLQGMLGIFGMVPLIGEPANLLNAGVDALNGDYASAGLAALPFVGFAGKVGQVGKVGLARSELREVINAWSKGRSKSIADSIRYHYGEHGAGQGVLNYTREAREFLETNKSLAVRHSLRTGGTGIKIKTGSHFGIYTNEGKIVTYGPR